MDFHPVEANLRESFRVLASGRASGEVLELAGVTIASSGVAFQMFNAAFLNGPVMAPSELEKRLQLARGHFSERDLGWAFWFCEDWLARPARRQLTQLCGQYGLRLSSELPGMVAGEVVRQKRILPALDFRRVDCLSTLTDFRSVGSMCFHVPPHWFAEVFHDRIGETSPEFVCWVGYHEGLPVATAATLISGGVIGLYNIAIAPGFRGRGMAEAITRHVLGAARSDAGRLPIILQATSLGHRMYVKLGFREVTRILVFSSAQ